MSQFKDTIGRNVWVKCFEMWYNSLPENTDVVVSDIRFPHELKSLNQMGASIIKIEKYNIGLIDTHESESHIDEMAYDYLITNNRNISFLEQQINIILRHMKGK